MKDPGVLLKDPGGGVVPGVGFGRKSREGRAEDLQPGCLQVPGVLLKDPGVLLKDPGGPLKDPGFL